MVNRIFGSLLLAAVLSTFSPAAQAGKAEEMFMTEAAFSSASDSFFAGPQWLRYALSSRVPLRSAQNVYSSSTTYQAQYVGTLLEPYQTSDTFISVLPHYGATSSSASFSPLPETITAIKQFDGGTAGNPDPATGGSTSWSATTAWRLDGVPTASDDVVFDNTFLPTLQNVQLGGANRVANSLTFSLTNDQTWALGASSGTGAATLTLTTGNITRTSTTDNSLVTVGAVSGAGIGTGVMTLATGASGFTITNSDTTGDLQINAIISGAKTVTTAGPGTTIFSGQNTYTGATTVNSGTLQISGAGADQALGATSGVTVNAGGTLLQTTSNQINNAANMNLNGGRYTINNASEGSTIQPGLGSLTLTSSSIISLAGTDVLHFDNSSLALWTPGETLSIYNWNGNPLGGGGSEQILFGTDLSGLTPAQLASIQFYSGEGTGAFLPGAFILPTGEIVPVPEMSTWISAALALGFIGFTQRRKLRGLIAGRA